MAEHPELKTERLLLRPFTLADAPDVQRLAGDRDIASTTLSIPHPYEDGMAEQWINSLQERFELGEFVNFALVLLADGALIGSIGLQINQAHQNAELGYWIGKPFWGNGYCTEAARAVLYYGFTRLGLHRIAAHHLSRNPSSGRVMEKIGMQYEGCERQRIKKWEVFEDVRLYAILKDEYESGLGRSLSEGKS
jgi:RimJ/RimL family protein N-acetyltransferase